MASDKKMVTLSVDEIQEIVAKELEKRQNNQPDSVIKLAETMERLADKVNSTGQGDKELAAAKSHSIQALQIQEEMKTKTQAFGAIVEEQKRQGLLGGKYLNRHYKGTVPIQAPIYADGQALYPIVRIIGAAGAMFKYV